MTQSGAFLLTLAVELPVVVACAATARASRSAALALAVLVLAANALTHPLLWIADARLAPSLTLPVRWALLETGAVIVEGALLAAGTAMSRRRALGLSLLANAASFAVGLVWNAVAGA